MRTRNDSIDLTKGIGMLLVMLSHSFIAGMFGLKALIFSFHMPLFFILSGYFAKPSSTVSIISSSFKRLVIPYIITSALMVCFLLLMGRNEESVDKIIAMFFPRGFNSKVIDYKFDGVIGATWFLIALLWTRLSFNAILKITPPHWQIIRQKIFVLVMSLLISVAAVLIANHVSLLPFGILEGVQATFFMAVGYYCRNASIDNKSSILIAAFIIWLSAVLFAKLDMAAIYYKQYPLAIIGGCSGTLITCNLSKILLSILPLRIKDMLTEFGRESLFVLCVHSFCFVPQFVLGLGGLVGFSFNTSVVILMFVLKYYHNHRNETIS